MPKCVSVVNLNIVTSFVGIGALSLEIQGVPKNVCPVYVATVEEL